MKKWIFSITAGVAGVFAGLWFSENFMHARLFLGGIEVDLSDPAAVQWAMANPTKSEWLTYVTFGQDILVTQPGSYWTTAVPAAFAAILFSVTFFLVGHLTRRKPEPGTPFLKAPSSPVSAQSRKTARLTGESGSSAPTMAPEVPDPDVVGDPSTAVNGQPAKLNGGLGRDAKVSRDVEQETRRKLEPEMQRDPEPGPQGEASSEAQRSEEPEEKVQVVQEEVGERPKAQAEGAPEKDTQKETEPETVQEVEQKAAQEIRVERPAPEDTQPPEGKPDILEDEIWKTHYDYLDAVRAIFDKLKARGEHMAVDFATRYMADPKDSDLEALVAQILEEERQRNRFSENDDIEAAHLAMMEYSGEAAAEFRRVIRILGEDVDLNTITQKIRQRFPKTDKRAGIDPYQMNENQIILELRGRGFEIIAPAGGPYSVKDGAGTRITKPINLLELQEFLKEQRGQ